MREVSSDLNFSVVYSTTRGRYTVSHSSSPFTLNNSVAFQFIGFQNLPASGSNTYEGLKAQINKPEFIYIIFKNFSGEGLVGNGMSFSFYIPMSGNYNDLIEYEPRCKQYMNMDGLNVSEFAIELRDENNSIIDMQNGEWEMAVEIEWGICYGEVDFFTSE